MLKPPNLLSAPNLNRSSNISSLQIAKMATASLSSNPTRTSLTMLGMIIGIAAVIAVIAVGKGVQKLTEQRITSLGTNVLMVMAGAATTGSGVNQGLGSTSSLTWEDAQAVAEQALSITAVTAFLQRPATQAVYGDQNIATTLIGTDLNYPQVKNIYPETGMFFSQSDLDNAQAVAVLGAKVKQQLFHEKDPIGSAIRVQGKNYQVIGVMQSKGAVGNQDQDDTIYIPLTSMSLQIVGNNAVTGTAITGFWLSTPNSSDLNAAQFQVTNLLRLRHDIHPPEADDFNIINQIDIINTFSTVMGLLTLMIGVVASISLVVGGIGIANIMLVSVSERTREIGVRKALGATDRAILEQFLIESILLSTGGGLLGIIFGVILTLGLTLIFQIPLIIPFWSGLLSCSLAITVGIIAGVVPARNAARLDPITALQSL